VGFFARLRGTNDESRSLPAPENELPWLPGLYTGPTNITPAQALAIGDVWACVRVLADAASSLPLHVYRKTGDGRQRVTSGKLVDLLEQPAPATSQADLISTLMAHVLIHGASYLAKYREQGEVAQLGLLLPERVRPKRVGGQVVFEYTPGATGQQTLTTADVVHVKGLSMDGLHGLSAVNQAASVIGLSDELVRHALSYFEQGSGLPAAVFRMPPGSSEDQKERYIEALRNRTKPQSTLVIEGEGAFESVLGKLDDQQFTEQRRLAAQEVARVFRIPPHMVGAPTGESMTYATVEQEAIDFVRFSLAPWLRRIELAISNDPDLAFAKQYVRFELDGLLRADAKTRAEVYALALDPVTGWMSRDEVRRLEDLEPEPEPTPAQIVTQAVAAAMTPGGGSNGSS
jgi:HK97 family phage portal protein